MIAAAVIWIAGLLVAVPYAAWHLLFHASRDQYALLITFILFWIFGYWGLAGPIVMTVKVRSLWRRLEQAVDGDERRRLLQSPESTDLAVDLIASETRLPKFLARRIHASVLDRLATRGLEAPNAARARTAATPED